MSGAVNLRRMSLVSGMLLVIGCKAVRYEQKASDSTAGLAPAVVSALAWALTTPPRWGERVRQVAIADSVRMARFPGARAVEEFEYTPRDPKAAPEVLLLVTVYDSATWVGIGKAGGPPVGEVITRDAGHVYVASLPQSNPFAPRSADARAFDEVVVTIDDVRRGFRVLK